MRKQKRQQVSNIQKRPEPLFYVVADCAFVNEYIIGDSDKKRVILMGLDFMPPYLTVSSSLYPEVVRFKTDEVLPVYQVSSFYDEERKEYCPMYLISEADGNMRWVKPPIEDWEPGFVPVFLAKDYMISKGINFYADFQTLYHELTGNQEGTT